jgi:hypothetical protein
MRTKKMPFVENVRKSEARSFVQKVFKLAQKLDIDYQQLAKESGLKVTQLYRLKFLWDKDKCEQKFLTFDLANGFVKFWNAHLEAETVEDIEIDIRFEVVALMLEKDGLKKTAKLLKQRDNLELLRQYLRTLSSEELADLL